MIFDKMTIVATLEFVGKKTFVKAFFLLRMLCKRWLVRPPPAPSQGPGPPRAVGVHREFVGTGEGKKGAGKGARFQY